MKLLATLVLSVLLGACASAPPAHAPVTHGPKALAPVPEAALVRRAFQIDSEYVATLERALKQVRDPHTDPRLLQGIQNAVADCGRVFDQLEKAAADPNATNLEPWIERAGDSLRNLHLMMEPHP
jgi:hypothetical protein